MAEWVPIQKWEECRQMERPGLVFEVRNASGQVLQTPCTVGVPTTPWDWAGAPVEFRTVVQEKPRHSAPIPSEMKK